MITVKKNTLGEAIKLINGSNTKMNLSLEKFNYDIVAMAVCFAALLKWHGETYNSCIEFCSDAMLDATKDTFESILEGMGFATNYDYDNTLSEGSYSPAYFIAGRTEEEDEEEYYATFQDTVKKMMEEYPEFQEELSLALSVYKNAWWY